ncbi:MAG: dihydroorotate dehydrogenase (quinone) [Candidatus Vogelbacteria bacterium RIFOXYD1_FULL_44_32]|uniref:Dihydroorotate dehydrogenase (quinone) n=1 Tax=Candidatus Vogelbacteria bacterium RIFOXYD1_FULL_44_32 TaxID=1802438 RepID=A0A1G2QEL9_9BACT|nr:MAG: dihydroorotate dehydrogenase (quinone) [Candidatus Vogelbacteria bacterium RIFOXYD1_FULL_44_32]
MPTLIHLRNQILHFGYVLLIKPILFRFNPEFVHDRTVGLGHWLGKFGVTRFLGRLLFSYADPTLRQQIGNLYFKNPVGLAAGFDKNSQMLNWLPALGFGFIEVGSLTAKPGSGNPGQHLWRLPKSKGLAVNFGLKNDGVEAIKPRIKKNIIPVGTNLAFTNDASTSTVPLAIADFAYSFSALADTGDYFTLNISCPNQTNDRLFWDPVALDQLLARLFAITTTKPVFIKISPDMTPDIIDEVVAVATRYPIAGFIISNLTKDRNNPRVLDQSVPPVGGMSGKVVAELADRAIAQVYKKTGGQYTIIGCGGIFSATDAYHKIGLGASLLQLVTGLVFEGPQLVSEINLGLAKLLRQNGYKNIQEAVGWKGR